MQPDAVCHQFPYDSDANGKADVNALVLLLGTIKMREFLWLFILPASTFQGLVSG